MKILKNKNKEYTYISAFPNEVKTFHIKSVMRNIKQELLSLKNLIQNFCQY